jgi:hypothetical protein
LYKKGGPVERVGDVSKQKASDNARLGGSRERRGVAEKRVN